jgi:hypothetical protein
MRIPRTRGLESISTLEHSNESPSRDALRQARHIVKLIERHRFPMPFVFPTEIGGIQLEWKVPGRGRELNLEVPPEGERLSFLKIVDGKPAREGEIVADIEREVCSLLDWMVTG